jgi:flagellar hook-associated protein 3 FlgL
MRISTNSFFESSSSRLTELQSQISANSDQITSGKRLLNPSDDPVAAAKIIGVQQSQSINTQFNKNITSIQNNLGTVDITLSDIVSNLQNMHDQIISAGSASIANGNTSISLNLASDKIAISLNLQGLYDQLLSLANSTDASGNYLFAGQKTNTAPFIKNADQASISTTFVQKSMLLGNQLLGEYKVSAGGSFTVPATTAETTTDEGTTPGSQNIWLDATSAPLRAGAVLSAGQIFYSVGTPGSTPSAPTTFVAPPTGAEQSLTNKQLGKYQVSFGGSFIVPTTTAATITTPGSQSSWLDETGTPLKAGSELSAGQVFYRVGTPGSTPSAPTTFVAPPTGTAIVTKGFFEYKGNTTENQIQVNTSQHMSASVLGSDMFSGGDIFNKLQAAITALNMPSDANATSLQVSALSDLSNSYTTTFAAVSNAQSSVGTRLNRLDSIKSANDNINLQLTQTLSGLQDTDYNKAVSDLVRQQFILQAAQKTFAQISKSSLFDFIA